MAVTDRHPDVERLAAYADGRLSDDARVDVQRHLADCASCRRLVVRTMASMAAEQSIADAPVVSPFRSRRWVSVAAGLAAAAVLVLAIRVVRPTWLGFGPRAERPELQELIAALANEPTRPVEGRLTGGSEYLPPPPVVRGSEEHRVSPEVRTAAAHLEQAVKVDNTPDNQAALGVGYLASNDVDRSILTLERAKERKPSDARILSDLAAAYIRRGVLTGQKTSFDQAVMVSNRAIALRPELVEAYFNRAIALELSASHDDAVAAWRRYLEIERDPQWAAEASTHLQRLLSAAYCDGARLRSARCV